MKEEYIEFQKGSSATVCIKEEEISLHIPPDTEIPETGLKKNGWELKALVHPLRVRIPP